MSLEDCLTTAKQATPDTVSSAQRDVYQQMFDADLLEAEVDLVIAALSKSTKATKTSLRKDWKRYLGRQIASEREALAGTTVDPAAKRADQYLVLRGAIHRERDTQDGAVTLPLCNFDARIAREEVRDDGAQQTVAFVIEGRLASGRELTPAEVPSAKYPAMGWVTEHWGAQALVEAGSNTKDHLRAAIQKLSGNVPRHEVYEHLGWRHVGNAWAYLHAGGAITSAGHSGDIEVAPADNRLGGFELPRPPEGEDLVAAIRASLEILTIGPLELVVPLLASAYRAPLCEVMPADFSVFAIGLTGTFKTELTSLVQAHFGSSFTGRNLPANWSATANALEKEAFMAKDAILTIDDFSPTGTPTDVARMHRDAERLLRAQGNHAGRDRMNADGSLRPTYFPRGLIVSSGEDAPKGHSLRSRVFFVEVAAGDVDLEALTHLQEVAGEGRLAQAMSGYVRWLAPQLDHLKHELAERRRSYRAHAAAGNLHRRTPDQVASLAMGLDCLLRYALEVDALTQAEVDELWSQGWAAIARSGSQQNQYLGHEDPVERFQDLLASAVASGAAHIADAYSGEEPSEPGRWGWRFSEAGPFGGRWEPRGMRVGWISSEAMYLDRGAVYAVVKRLARDQDDNLTMSAQTLWRRMKDRGLLMATDPDRTTVRRILAKEQRQVLQLSPAYLSTPVDDHAVAPPGARGQQASAEAA